MKALILSGPVTFKPISKEVIEAGLEPQCINFDNWNKSSYNNLFNTLNSSDIVIIDMTYYTPEFTALIYFVLGIATWSKKILIGIGSQERNIHELFTEILFIIEFRDLEEVLVNIVKQVKYETDYFV